MSADASDHNEDGILNDDARPSSGAATGEGGKRSRGPRAVAKALLVFLILAFLAFLYWFFFSRGVISTDDAYTAGNVVRVFPLTSGAVTDILTDNTRLVNQGDVLARLDATDASLAFEKARNNLISAARSVASRLSQRDGLKASVDVSRKQVELNRSEYDRRRRLVAGRSITREELDNSRIELEISEASLRSALFSLEQINRQIGGGAPAEDPAIRLAKAELLRAWLDLERCEIKSPVSGRVAKRAVQLGNQVGPGAPLLMVVNEDEVWVDANFKESQLGALRAGQKAEVTVDMLGSGRVFKGVVAGLSPGTGSVFSLLPAENATGNWIKVVQRVPVRIILLSDWDGGAVPPLILGLSCRVRVFTDEAPEDNPPRLPDRRSEALVVNLDEKSREIDALVDGILAGDFPPGEEPVEP